MWAPRLTARASRSAQFGRDHRALVGVDEADDRELGFGRDALDLPLRRRAGAGDDAGDVGAVADEVVARRGLEVLDGLHAVLEVGVLAVDPAVEHRDQLALAGPFQRVGADQRARPRDHQARRVVDVEPPHAGGVRDGGEQRRVGGRLEADEQRGRLEHLHALDRADLLGDPLAVGDTVQHAVERPPLRAGLDHLQQLGRQRLLEPVALDRTHAGRRAHAPVLLAGQPRAVGVGRLEGGEVDAVLDERAALLLGDPAGEAHVVEGDVGRVGRLGLEHPRRQGAERRPHGLDAGVAEFAVRLALERVVAGLGRRGLGVERVDDDALRGQLAHAVAVEPALEDAVVRRDLAAAAERLRGRGPLRLAGVVDGRAERLRHTRP